MEIEFANMSVRCFGQTELEKIRRSWIVSRPNDYHPDMEKVLQMDVPVNEFAHFYFEAEVPILMREVICSLRNHIVWARSSRVDDLSSWRVFGDESLRHTYSELQARMKKEMESKHQDDFRRHLPLGYMTKFCFSFSFRDLVRFCSALFEHKFEMFRIFNLELINSLPDSYIRSKIRQSIGNRSYQPLALCPRPESIATGKIGDFHVLSMMIPLSLRAQLVRHRAITIHDEISTLFSNEMLGCSMEHRIMSQVVLSNSFAEQLLRKRSCWIAQSDLWEPILKQLRKNFGASMLLPCDDGHCRFKADNDLRKANRDPSPPCPVAARLAGERMTDGHAVAASIYAERRFDSEFWKKEIENVQV